MIRRFLASIRARPLVSLELAALLVAALILRFADLGYANLQGDEIKALCFPGSFQSPFQFLAFLLAQRKGPVEFTITCSVGLIDPTFSSQLLLRLPFAVANLLSLACLFVVARRLFSRQAAIYSTFLMAANGVLVAFGRFAQYQSFVMLGVSAALMAMVLAVEGDRWRIPGLYLGFAAAACGLLAHFDAAFVLPPMAVLSVHWWLQARRRPDARRLTWHLAGAMTLFLMLVLSFYVEYALHLGPTQIEYWQKRFTAATTDTLRIALYYAPAPVVWFSLATAGLGCLRIRWNLGWQTLLAWLIFPLLFMELLLRDSGTHAYTYFMPLLMLGGIGLEGIVVWLRRRLGERAFGMARITLLVTLLINAYASYALFVDHAPEYPWQPKTALGTNMPGGGPMSTFGFPYNRDWRAIGDWFAALPSQNKIVVTNEKPVIAAFYLPSSMHYQYELSDTPDPLPTARGLYFVVVDHPQSWQDKLWGWTAPQWRDKLTPAQTFYNPQGQPVAWVYFLTSEQRTDLFR